MSDSPPIADPAPHSFGHLPRVLGLFSSIAVVVGSIIGSGIFIKPAGIAQQLGASGFGSILFVWAFVGLVTLCGSLALAELAAMLPHAGGPYVYLREAYGQRPAFLWGWTEFWVVRTGSLGALACATTLSLHEVVPLTFQVQEAVTIGIVVGLSALNIVGARWGAAMQNLTTVLKVAFLGLIIVLPFALREAHPAHLRPLAPPAVDWPFWKGLAAAMIAVLWAYDGWINIAPVAEEIREPQRNIPVALFLGVTLVTFVYMAANVAYHLVLPMNEVAGSDVVAATMVGRLWGERGGQIVALGIMCSTFGAVNSNLLTGPRVYFAMARDGLLHSSIRQVHERFQTPANAIFIQSAWALVLIVVVYASTSEPINAFDALTNFVIFGGSIFYAMAVGAVFILRRTMPDQPRPYRTWGYPVVPALYLAAFAAALASLLIGAPVESIAGLSLIVVGAVYYAWIARSP